MVSGRDEAGFTVVELMVVVAVMAVLAGPILAYLMGNYTDSLRSQVKVQLAASGQSTLRTLTEEIKTSGGALNKNTLNDPNAPSGGWTTGSSSGVMVVKLPAIATTGEVIQDSSGNAYYNEAVYFRTGSNLFRRVIRNAAAPGNTALTTCPRAVATTACPADSVLASTVSAFSFLFLKEQGALSSSTDDALSVKITLNFSKSFSGSAVASSHEQTVRFRGKR